MANPWDSDPVVGGNPWDNDPVTAPAPKKPTAGKKKPDFSNVRGRFVSTEEGAKTGRVRRMAELEGDVEKLRYKRMTQSGGFLSDLLSGVGYSGAQTATGLKQLAVEHPTMASATFTHGLRGVGANGLADLIDRNVSAPLYGKAQEFRGDVAKMRRENEWRQGNIASKIGEIAGTAAQFVGPGFAARGTALAPVISPLGVRANAVQGGVIGFVQPYESNQERVTNAAVGGIGGSVLPGLMKLRGANAVKPEVRELASKADALGIPLHPSQVTDSIVGKVISSNAKYLPFSGAAKAADRQQRGFNRALARTIGAESDTLSDDVVSEARRGISRNFEDVYNRNDIRLTPDNLRKLASLQNEAGERLVQDEARVVSNQVDKILREMGEDGLISGQKYQALRTQLMKAEGGDSLGSAIKSIRKELDTIANNSVGPQDAATLAKIRGQWANLKTIEALLKQVAGAGGDIKPSAVWPAIRNGSTKEMREIGRIGQKLLKDAIPDSGTPARNLYLGSLVTGGAIGGPGALATLGGIGLTGATIGRASNSNALAKLLVKASRDPRALTAQERLILGSLNKTSAATASKGK